MNTLLRILLAIALVTIISVTAAELVAIHQSGISIAIVILSIIGSGVVMYLTLNLKTENK